MGDGMAKTPKTSPQKPDMVNEALRALAEIVLSDFFFDPDNEQAYKRALAEHRPSGTRGVMLDEETIEQPDGDVVLRIEALRALTRFRVV